MSQSKTDPLIVFHDIEGYSAGAALSEWPFHFTVIPYFTVENTNLVTAINIIRIVAKAIGPFTVNAGVQANYGPDNDIAVTTLYNPEGKLKTLHNELIERLGTVGCNFIDLTY